MRLVHLLPGRWLIERCEDDFGAVSALLMQDLRGGGGLTFALFRHAREINLDLRRNGRFEPLGTFRVVGRAIDQVLDHVEHAWPGGVRVGISGESRCREAISARDAAEHPNV